MSDEAKPKNFTERLQPWQPSIAACLGFTGVILAMLYNGQKDRAIKIEEEFRAAQATAYGIYLDMQRIEEPLRLGEYGAYYVQNEMVERKSERVEMCLRYFEVEREKKIQALGVFDVIKSNLGRVPPKIISEYLAALRRLDEVKRITSTSPLEQKTSCEQRPIGEVGNARYAFGFAVHSIEKLADALVRQYPELAIIAEQRATQPEYVPLDVRMTNERKIEQIRSEESKAAIEKAEAAEAAEAKRMLKK